MVEYQFQYTEEHIVESFNRYRAQLPKRLWRIPLKTFCFLGLGLLLYISISSKIIVPGIAFLFFLVLLILGPRFDYWLMKRKFRQSPFYNNNVTITLDEKGYRSECKSSKTEMPWQTFTKVSRMHDGFLVFTGPQQFHWWPDSALIGSLEKVEKLLSEHVSA